VVWCVLYKGTATGGGSWVFLTCY